MTAFATASLTAILTSSTETPRSLANVAMAFLAVPTLAGSHDRSS
jgi:hypothetical protein